MHFVPGIFMFLAGVVSAGTRKYAEVLRKLEIPLSLVGWAVASLATFIPLMTLNPDQRAANDTETKPWQDRIRMVLVALLVSACVVLAEKLLIQLIGINYHRKQFNEKINDSKRNVQLLSELYDASRELFPMYCNEFSEEDYIIGDDFGMAGKKSHKRSGSATPLRLLQTGIHNAGRLGDKITSVFGHVAQEITGKRIMDPNSAHWIVTEALENPRRSEALAKRIWMSFVVEGKNELYQADIEEVLGANRQADATEAFAALDRDGNGDISMDEMILTVTEIGRERKSIASSMADVDQAIHVLDGLLSTIVFIICIFVFIAFLNASFVTTLATAGTALLSLSFVFAGTAQEVLGSCIFLFVKHPYDIGDRVDLGTDQLTVEHISLLFTAFKRVNTGKLVQIPNIVLNNLWIENITRSKAMREQISIFCSFDTSFEDIKALKNEMINFVNDPENKRDFQPDIEVEVVGIAEMNKLELRVEIRHKSNWANEMVRATRRSKFMCALVVALRKVPIYGPGGGDAALGDQGKPSYSVAVSLEQAQEQRSKYLQDKEAKRLVQPESKPSKKDGDGSGTEYGSGNAEFKAINSLNTRPPALDPARDDAYANRDDLSTLGRPSTDRPELEEVRGLLHKQSTSGKRRADLSPTEPVPPMPNLATSSRDYAPPPNRTTSLSNRQMAATTPQPPRTPNDGEEYQRMMAQPLRMHSIQQDSPGRPRRPTDSSGTAATTSMPGNAFAQQQMQMAAQQQQRQREEDRLGPANGGQYRPYSGV
jgi:hypothetical protein